MQQTVLVTGGAGYIGSHTALLLAQHGYKVVIIDDLSQGQSFDHLQQWATCIQADFADQKTVTTVFKEHSISAVIHCAAFIEVGESVKMPLKFYTNNVLKTVQLIDVMIAHGISKFIYSSSCAVYGEPHYLPLNEVHPKTPLNPYGKTKLMVEEIMHDVSVAHEFSYVALRYFNAAGALPEYGLGELHTIESHLIPLLLRAVQTEKVVSIFGADYPTKDGTCIRDYVHVVDIAQAHVQALKHLEAHRPSDIFNLGTGHGFSVKQVIECVEKITETTLKTIIAPRRAGDAPHLVADPSKAHYILQWQPRCSDLEFMIRSAYLFEQERNAVQPSPVMLRTDLDA